MSKVGVHIIHGNIGILSEFSKSQGAYYTWGCIIHGNLRYRPAQKRPVVCGQTLEQRLEIHPAMHLGCFRG